MSLSAGGMINDRLIVTNLSLSRTVRTFRFDECMACTPRQLRNGSTIGREGSVLELDLEKNCMQNIDLNSRL
jgi:hypothetical protein